MWPCLAHVQPPPCTHERAPPHHNNAAPLLLCIESSCVQALGVSFLKGGAAPQPKAFSGAPDQNAEAFGRLRQLKPASADAAHGLTGFGMRDIGRGL